MRDFRAEASVGGANFCVHTKQKMSDQQAAQAAEGKIGSSYLTDYSRRDKPWDEHRALTDDVALVYAAAADFKRYAERMSECSEVLSFGWCDDRETGVTTLKLREAHFCRVRNCPTCQKRRAMMWQARFYQALPEIQQQHPKARWIFATFTVRNCSVTELRCTLHDMNKAWHRLVKRKELKHVLGWIRTTEITRGQDGSAHPHFHALMIVPPTMFTKHYIKQLRWIELWRDCARLDYEPIVDVRTVKPKAPKEGQTALDTTAQALGAAAAETLKYAVKPSDMLADEAWFLELTKQTHRLRFIATGGALKDVLKVEQESDKDLAMTEGQAEQPDDGERLAFSWRDGERRYKRFKRGDKPANTTAGGDQ